MAQHALGGIAADLSAEGRDVSEAESTFDRLLRAYFARLMIGEFPAMGDVSHSFELPLADRSASGFAHRQDLFDPNNRYNLRSDWPGPPAQQVGSDAALVVFPRWFI
ncbi:hypothetical protein [Bradyrhizobium iriomotense]|uniref:Uncharacterized protein n=1 Tax=Bradyrhizobium iriomotense TaxID=441950 RepID=A0ABQ6B5Z7_9BRAD|nr:hypothetical protein [Bradyrhizobium iriomotense]GLR88026.1 hypothetical protein GCM10007857_47380 [Bradyrhizobium iriomotense]